MREVYCNLSIMIPVRDRIPTYPGRVVLTPVSGQTNTYDLARADLPIEEGTPINKALLDNKAYTLTESVTVYVSTTGNDTDGDGSSAAPFATIQKAVDSIPRFMGGYNALIDIADGTYDERIMIEGFYGGRLTVGVAGRTVVVNGISVLNSSAVILAISNVTHGGTLPAARLYLAYGSHVTLAGDMSIDNLGQNYYGIALEYGGILISRNNVNVIAAVRPYCPPWALWRR